MNIGQTYLHSWLNYKTTEWFNPGILSVNLLLNNILQGWNHFFVNCQPHNKNSHETTNYRRNNPCFRLSILLIIKNYLIIDKKWNLFLNQNILRKREFCSQIYKLKDLFYKRKFIIGNETFVIGFVKSLCVVNLFSSRMALYWSTHMFNSSHSLARTRVRRRKFIKLLHSTINKFIIQKTKN